MVLIGHRSAVLTLVALILSLGAMPGAVLRASAADTANIYLVAIGDNGQSGQLIGCQDSLVPVSQDGIADQPTIEAKITAALGKLLAIHTQYYGQSGLYNALYQSNLSIDSVQVEGTRAIVRLSGTLQLGGECDGPRVFGQITSTVLQFPGLNSADIAIQGTSLDSRVSLGGDEPGSNPAPETAYVVNNGFLRFWENFGGLAAFGYPISNEFVEDGVTVQYFQRARFEWHPGAAPDRYDVLLGLLGNEVAVDHENQAPYMPVQATNDANCTFYAPTGHRLCFGFRDYWQSHGGLAIFGYPISEEFQENGMTVQYFQRQRLEYHPENPSQWQVLGGLLGTQLYQAH